MIGDLRIIDGKVYKEVGFTDTTFATAIGVYPATIGHWRGHGKIDLTKSLTEVIHQFYLLQTECTSCGRRIKAQSGEAYGEVKWCPWCGEPRLKIGTLYYVSHTHGDDANNGLTTGTAFETSSKAMCRARHPKDTITYLAY